MHCTRMQQQQKTMTVIIFQKKGFRECKFSLSLAAKFIAAFSAMLEFYAL